MPQPPDVALAHYSDRQSLVTAGAEVAGQMWAEVNPDHIVESWTAQVPELTAVLSGAQLGAARQADPYLDEVAAWQELDATTASPIDPRAFAGTASDGRGLMSLLMSPAFSALQVIASGVMSRQAMSLGGQHLDTIARTQVADAGRLADGVALAARRGIDGYVRMVIGKTCSRCMLLAGRHYKWNAGFKRHNRCDCIHVPSSAARAGKLIQNPHRLYESMTAKERQRAGWSLADQQAIADGADLAQITNAHRGVYTAGGRKFTTEGTTKRGFARSRLGKRARMTPEQIYAEAADRDEALRLLYDHGYLVNEPAMLSRSRLGLAASKASGITPAKAAATAGPPIRRILAMQRTTEDVGRAFEFEAERLTGRRIRGDFEGSSPATAREHAEGILRGLERFPNAELHGVVTFEEAVSTYAEAGRGEIAFNLHYSSATGRPRYLRSLQGDNASGWSVRGAGSPAGVGIHEFAHIIDIDNLGEAIHTAVDDLVRRLAAREGVAADALIGRQVSKYATTNGHELVAEAFTDVLINGERASELSRGIFDLLEAEYARGGGVVRQPAMATAKAVSRAEGLAGKTVPELRALAKERGIKVPSKALKADIVKLLEGGTAPAAPLAGAAKRAAARVRQAEIDRRGAVGDLLANMDELIAKKADRAVFAQRLDYAATTGVDAATVTALRLLLDDKTKLRAAMTRIGTKNGLKPVGRAGQKVKFDETLHDALGAPPAAGTQVLVVRRGTTLTLDGEMIPLDKAQVTTAVAPAKKAAPAKTVTPAPEPSILTPEEQRFKAAMQAMARERKAAEALAPPPKPLPPPPPRKTLAQIRAETEANGGLTAEERAWVDGMKAAARERKAAEAAAAKKTETKAAVKKAEPAKKTAPVTRAAPVKKVPPTRMTAEAAKYQADLVGMEDLARRVESSRSAERRQLDGGNSAKTSLVTTSDGTRLVEKITDEYTHGQEASAEQGASWIAQALGMKAPRVYRNGQDTVYMDFMSGRTAKEIKRHGKDWPAVEQAMAASDDAKLMGLLDQLITNGDRNPGNWMIDDAGRLIPVDHSMTFPNRPGDVPEPAFWGDRGFASHYVAYAPGARDVVFIDNPLTRADIAELRKRLEALRPHFEHIDKGFWLTYALDALDALAPYAKGTRNLIAGVR